jgi:glycerophosphoryl diester phosphodiesterase
LILDGRRFLIVGHRGAAARAPENTAAGLLAGLSAGADQIEVDVGLTRDGRPVLLHDTTLDRTTSGRGPLRAMNFKPVEALDAGSWFSPRFAGEPPIDLDDALAIVRPRIPLIVEIKPTVSERARGIDPADRDTVEAVLAAFLRTGGLRGVTMSSAGWTLLLEASKRIRGLDCALTVRSTETRDPIAWAQRIGATALHPSRKLCTPTFVARARGLGLLVIAYTVNRASELSPLLEAGVDGVFTDDPAAMRRLLSRRVSAPAAGGTLALGIDQGSGGTRAVLIDAGGAIVSSHETRVASRRDPQGAIVQDAEAVVASVVRAAGPLVREAARRVTTAGLAVQRSSLVVWRAADARPVTPVISWRSEGHERFQTSLAPHEAEIHRSTGLTARYPYGAIRLAALCAESPEIAAGLREGRMIAGPLGAFLVARLSEGQTAPCDPSLAQRTLAYDIVASGFSEELARWHGLEPAFWSGVSPSAGERGRLRLGRSHVPLRALLGDVGAAARAVLGDVAEAEDGALVLGTGGFVVVPTGRTPRHVDGLLTTLLYQDVDGPVFAVEGTVHGLVASIVESGRRGGWEGLEPERIAARSGAAARSPRVDAAPEGTGTPDWESTRRFEVEAGDFTPEELVRGTIDDLTDAPTRREQLPGALRRHRRARGVAPSHLETRRCHGRRDRRGPAASPDRGGGSAPRPRWPLGRSIPGRSDACACRCCGGTGVSSATSRGAARKTLTPSGCPK